jgi:MFS family permease
MGGTYLLIFLAVSIFISVLLYKYPRFGSVKFGYMCIVIGCLLLNLKSLTWGVLVISAFLNGVALAIIYAALNSWASNFGSGRQKSFFMAAFTATYDTGFITGTILSGIFAKYYGLRNLFSLASSIAFFSLVGAIIFLSSRYGGNRA